ncbi:hypothetical protein Syun_007173 [Stephania yunnanensis]|uniref:PEP-utilising enzyme C-terminal domain-containing protein n=1 Tax=Stephania yunnanensis TaxID=152371 RepID=A0AAP0KZR3_9MAGN
MNVPAVDGGLLKPDVVEGLQVSEVGLVGIVEASELGGGYGGFLRDDGLGAYRGESSLGYSILATESLPFNSLSCRLFKYATLSKQGRSLRFEGWSRYSIHGQHLQDMDKRELEHQVSLIRDVSKKLFSEMGTSIGYKIGTMIEIPRAALVADEIAEQVEFFSFGTNDLTQMTFGYSRDDVGKFLPIYLSKGIPAT